MTAGTLVVLAAGLGSRYSGAKQLERLGPSGEMLLDYSIYDAERAGFERVVIVTRPELKDALLEGRQDLRRVIRAAVIHDDDLELGGEPPPDFSRLRDHARDIAFLVETRNHHRKTHRAEPNSRTTPLQMEEVTRRP